VSRNQVMEGRVKTRAHLARLPRLRLGRSFDGQAMILAAKASLIHQPVWCGPTRNGSKATGKTLRARQTIAESVRLDRMVRADSLLA
jgi:hypothetical protein